MNAHGTNMTFGLIVGNRGFFPDHLAKSGREEMIARAGRRRRTAWWCSGPEDTKYGAVETRAGGANVRGPVPRSIATRSTASS